MSKTVKLFLALFVIMFFNTSPCQASYAESDDEFYSFYDNDIYDFEIFLPEIDILWQNSGCDEDLDKGIVLPEVEVIEQLPWDKEVELPNIDIFASDPFSIVDDVENSDAEVEKLDDTTIDDDNNNNYTNWADKSVIWLKSHAYTYKAYLNKKKKGVCKIC